jgi:hypothetical protein
LTDGLIREAQDLVPGRDQLCFSLSVVFALCVVDCSVNLDSEAMLGTAEIDYERANWVLTAEL